MTMAGKFPDFGALFPHWLYSTFNPNDKTNLAPYRFLHFVVIVFLVIRFVPKDWPGLEWRVFDPRWSAASIRSRCSASASSCPLSAISTDDELGLAARADFRQRVRDRDHDAGRLLHLLVEKAGQAAAQAGGGQGFLTKAPE